MTREEAIKILKGDGCGHCTWQSTNPYECENEECTVKEALNMAIQALENIGHLTDRPCSVCEFHKENGCCQWTCVFTDRLFGDMR